MQNEINITHYAKLFARLYVAKMAQIKRIDKNITTHFVYFDNKKVVDFLVYLREYDKIKSLFVAMVKYEIGRTKEAQAYRISVNGPAGIGNVAIYSSISIGSIMIYTCPDVIPERLMY